MKKIIFALALLCASSVNACTGMKLVAKDGSFVHGRTLEFGIPVDISCVVIPRGHQFRGTTPLGNGISYTSKYASVGAVAFGNPAIMDGINEKGLAVGTFYFPTYAGYSEITPQNQSRALSPAEFPNWIVTQFATIEEVQKALKEVLIAPTVIKQWGSTPAPFHYIVYDKTGRSLVIEPMNGKLITHDNPIGTFTNSPTFDWHMTNLRNYINLTPFNSTPVTVDGVEFQPFGQGSGMVGIPGDYTPPSRFVRAAIFSSTATPSDNSEQAVYQMFHLLNPFDIPVGVIRSKEGDGVHTDKTQFTCVRDPQGLKYYFRTYNDQTIQVIDLHAFDWTAKAVKALNVTGVSKAVDVSSKLTQ